MPLNYRSGFLVDVFEKYVPKTATILEIGCGDGRNVKWLKAMGWKKVAGIDKIHGTAIEDVKPKVYDVVYTMSTLFLLQDEKIFKKIAGMAKKMIITVEGETTSGYNHVIGRDYSKVFAPFGFEQIDFEANVFNQYGVLRVLKHGDNH